MWKFQRYTSSIRSNWPSLQTFHSYCVILAATTNNTSHPLWNVGIYYRQHMSISLKHCQLVQQQHQYHYYIILTLFYYCCPLERSLLCHKFLSFQVVLLFWEHTGHSLPRGSAFLVLSESGKHRLKKSGLRTSKTQMWWCHSHPHILRLLRGRHVGPILSQTTINKLCVWTLLEVLLMVCLRRSTVKCEAKVLEEPVTVRTYVYIIYTKSRTGIGNLRDRVSIENAQ